MNNNFTNLSQIDLIRKFDNKEYKHVIQLLKNYFDDARDFKIYIDKNKDNNYYDKYLSILIIFNEKETIDKVLRKIEVDINDIKNLDLDNDYIKILYDDSQIKRVKESINSLLKLDVLKRCLALYDEGEIGKVFNLIHVYFNDYYDYVDCINNKYKTHFSGRDIINLREISYQYFYFDFKNYKYSIILHLINVYKLNNTNYFINYLKRFNKFKINLNEIVKDNNLLNLFNVDDQQLIVKIAKEYSKNMLDLESKNNSFKFSNITDSVDVVMNVLLQKENKYDSYYHLKYMYRYSPYKLEQTLKSKSIYNIYNNKTLVDYALFIKDYIYSYDSIKDIKKEEEKVKDINLVSDFISSNMSIDEYCEDYSEKQNLIRALERIKRKVPELYNKYKISISENKKSEESLLYELSQKIIDNIKKNPNFDIVEYLKLTNTNHSDLIRGYKSNKENINKSDLMLLINFVNKNTKGDEITEDIKEKLYNTRQTYIFNKDGKDMFIEASLEDKNYVFEQINANPNLNYTRPYALILKRRVKKRFDMLDNK